MVSFLLIILLCFFLSFSAFLSASETAFFSLSSFTVKAYKQDPDGKKQLISHLLSKPRELLVTLMILNVFSNILIQNIISSLSGPLSSWILKVGLPLSLTLLLGEMIPKTLALAQNTAIAYKSAPLIAWLTRILKPIRLELSQITSYISRILFFFLKNESSLSKEELQWTLKSSLQSGMLSQDEVKLVHEYLELRYATIKEKMQPKEDIFFYDIHQSISFLISLFKEKNVSKILVCDTLLDNVLGTLSIQNFLQHQELIKKGKDLEKFLEKVFFIPESISPLLLLHKLREQKNSIALVVNEYGSIVGLVTEKELLDDMLGKSFEAKENKEFTLAEKDVIIASGKMELSEFEEIFGISLENPTNVVTLGGWITEHLGKIPQTGEKFSTKDFFFHILSASPNRVKRIYIRYLKPEN